MHQGIRYVSTADGVNLAWTSHGHGIALVKAATWLTHLGQDPDSPVWGHWVRFLGAHFRYVRYDERGCGMSDHDVADLALPQWVDDLACVVDAAAIDGPFVLLGISQGAATAITYAARYPQHVSHLILYGGYAVGGSISEDPQRREFFEAVMHVVRLGWGSDNPAFRQLFTSRFVPEGTQAQIDWFNDLCRRTTSAQNAGELLSARGRIDVRDALSRVRTPTLVLHATHDRIAPLSQGRYLAAHIPGARFIELDSHNHVLLEHEPAWQAFQDAVLAFTGHVAPARQADHVALTARERALLALLCEGRTNAQMGWQLGIAEKTVRNHLSNLYRKLGVRSRAEAIVRERRVAEAGPG